MDSALAVCSAGSSLTLQPPRGDVIGPDHREELRQGKGKQHVHGHALHRCWAGTQSVMKPPNFGWLSTAAGPLGEIPVPIVRAGLGTSLFLLSLDAGPM